MAATAVYLYEGVAEVRFPASLQRSWEVKATVGKLRDLHSASKSIDICIHELIQQAASCQVGVFVAYFTVSSTEGKAVAEVASGLRGNLRIP